MGASPRFSPLLTRHANVVHAFFDRHNGVSVAPFDSLNVGAQVGDDPLAVTQNRARVAHALGREASGLVFAEQVHGTEICRVTTPPKRPPQADVLVTREPRVTLALYTADCVPLLLAAPSAVAAAHAGWRGTAANIAGRAIDALCQLDQVGPDEVSVALGPAIGPCCFAVDEAVGAQLAACADGLGVSPARAGSVHVDLWALNEALARRAGAVHVACERVCTRCSPVYFSHRGERGRTGRQAAAIGLFVPGASVER